MFTPTLKVVLLGCIIIAVLQFRSASAQCDGKNNKFPLWTHWTACSVTCGKGSRSRECRCFDKIDPNVAPAGTGGCDKDAEKDRKVQKEECDKGACPPSAMCDGTNNKFPLWSHWTACTVTCGSGKRSRECRCFDKKDPKVVPGGAGGCDKTGVVAKLTQKEVCNAKICPTVTTKKKKDDDDDKLKPLFILVLFILFLPLLKSFG